jgi:glyoxylase-like metal-dependent hydrolase (beta-lactamase superfamily II)
VDAGKTRGAGERIVRLIRSISPKPVKAVFITHWHQDHVLGLGPIVEAWPSVHVITSIATANAILTDESYKTTPRKRGETASRDSARSAALRQYAEDYGANLHNPQASPEERRGWANVLGVLNFRIADEQGTYLVIPTLTFNDHYEIDDPVAPVQALALGPSHTEGDIVVWTPKQRVVASGDMVVEPIPYGAENALEWPGTLRKLLALGPNAIVPGHGNVLRDDRYVKQVIAGLEEMRAKVQPLIAGPALVNDTAMAGIDLSGIRKRFAGTDRWLAYWFDQYFAPNATAMYRQVHALEPGDARP